MPDPCIGNDPTCPCQDGDMCHYRGPNPWPSPRTDTDRIEFLRVYGIVTLLAFEEQCEGLDIREAIDKVERLVHA